MSLDLHISAFFFLKDKRIETKDKRAETAVDEALNSSFYSLSPSSVLRFSLTRGPKLFFFSFLKKVTLISKLMFVDGCT